MAGEREAIDAASLRLMLALDALEAAVDRRRETDRAATAQAEQMHAIGNDRARLAAELDAAAARAQRLTSAGREVERRIEAAMATVRDVIERNDR